jgi:uncharacterized membrane protein HdeD (DUF308 family)
MAHIVKDIPPATARHQWGWFVALGVLLLVCSLIAFGNIFAATVVSIYFVGLMMLIGGVAYLVHAFQVRTWQHVLFWALSGVLYLIAGILAFTNPLFASAILTLMLAFSLTIAGVLRIFVGSKLKSGRGWGWIVFSGIVTILAGVVIAIGWPVNSLWILGLFLAIDLLFQGWTLIAFGFTIRN